MSNRFNRAALSLGIGAAVMLGWSVPSVLQSPAAAATDSKSSTDSSKPPANAKPAKPDASPDKAKYDPAAGLTSEEKARLGADPAEIARMHRMSANLLKPQLQLSPEAADKKRAEWADRFHKESNPLLREEIITEMVQLDDERTIDTMISLFDRESHPGVREQVILILGYMRATNTNMTKVCAKLMSAYDHGADNALRARILEVVSNLPKPEAVAFMKTAFTSPTASAEDRFHAAEGLFKLAPRIDIGADLARTVTDRLKRDAESAPTAKERALAAIALSAPGQNNKLFLRRLLATEKDPELRKFLELAAEEYPTH